ncbi:helix-turn-helix protein [Krasilnikovia cinnamomea]|uniref:Helix-turn-helix protein n=1 Tax=Krasilnikovia cinnamomea TaxID=349313 RepID=A0A4Q7ZGH3_9ACTN|nr:helix-turn-helix transcriptional regulator [Krasilnikovia cinnamomea]RZU49892.1 helix-turn-helix protein [Krasilnikovia cinnamomea]
MSTQVSPTVRRRRLGLELKRLREEQRLSREEVAAHLEVSVSTVSRIETGRGGLRPKDLRQLLDLYGVADEETRADLEALARAGKVQGWWTRHAGELRSAYSTFIGLEAEASWLLDFEAITVPGLLQTESYARALLASALPAMTDDAIEARVRVRIQRQLARLDGPTPVDLWAIIDESVIRRRVGGPLVMREQLKHLIDMAGRPNVTLQVLPYAAGAHPGVIGSFVVLRFAQDPDVAYIEGVAGDVYAEGTDVQRFTLAFDGLRASAASPSASRDMLEAALDDLR